MNTLSGGDPLYIDNRDVVLWLLSRIKQHIDIGVLPKKTVWLYTGFTWEDILAMDKGSYILKYVDVLVDGKFDINKMDSKYPWAGSTNQRVIDVQKSLIPDSLRFFIYFIHHMYELDFVISIISV